MTNLLWAGTGFRLITCCKGDPVSIVQLVLQLNGSWKWTKLRLKTAGRTCRDQCVANLWGRQVCSQTCGGHSPAYDSVVIKTTVRICRSESWSISAKFGKAVVFCCTFTSHIARVPSCSTASESVCMNITISIIQLNCLLGESYLRNSTVPGSYANSKLVIQPASIHTS